MAWQVLFWEANIEGQILKNNFSAFFSWKKTEQHQYTLIWKPSPWSPEGAEEMSALLSLNVDLLILFTPDLKKKKNSAEGCSLLWNSWIFFTVCLHPLTSTQGLGNRSVSTPIKCSQMISEMAVLKKNKPLPVLKQKLGLCTGRWDGSMTFAIFSWPIPKLSRQSPPQRLLAIKGRRTLAKEHTGLSSSGSSYKADPSKITEVTNVTESIFAFPQI